MPFILQQMYASEPDVWYDLEYHLYENVAQANATANDQNSSYQRCGYDHRLRVVEIPMEDDRCWRLREKYKLLDGTHQAPPWTPRDDLWEHIDPAKATMIRFFRDEKDALRNRYTSMTVGRFLNRYHSMTQAQIEKYCAQVGLDNEVSKLHISKTADDFERVYLNGPHSCMAYEATDGRYGEENTHPVRLYGDLDLAVAYIERYGDITGRCLVWPEKKIHGRIYGDRERMLLRLAEEGYTEDWAFEGARLHLVKNKYNEIRAPYVDGDLHGSISECGKYIILSKTEGNLVLKSDGGTIYTDRCGNCDTVEGPFVWSDDHDCYTCDSCYEMAAEREYEDYD